MEITQCNEGPSLRECLPTRIQHRDGSKVSARLRHVRYRKSLRIERIEKFRDSPSLVFPSNLIVEFVFRCVTEIKIPPFESRISIGESKERIGWKMVNGRLADSESGNAKRWGTTTVVSKRAVNNEEPGAQ